MGEWEEVDGGRRLYSLGSKLSIIDAWRGSQRAREESDVTCLISPIAPGFVNESFLNHLPSSSSISIGLKIPKQKI